MVKHLFPSHCQLYRTSLTFCLFFDTVPFGLLQQARNSQNMGGSSRYLIEILIKNMIKNTLEYFFSMAYISVLHAHLERLIYCWKHTGNLWAPNRENITLNHCELITSEDYGAVASLCISRGKTGTWKWHIILYLHRFQRAFQVSSCSCWHGAGKPNRMQK